MSLTVSSDTLIPPPDFAMLFAAITTPRRTILPNRLIARHSITEMHSVGGLTNDSRQEHGNENTHTYGGQSSRLNIECHTAKHTKRHNQPATHRPSSDKVDKQYQQKCCFEEGCRIIASQVLFLLSQKRVSLPRYVRVIRAVSRKADNREPSILHSRKNILPLEIQG